MPRGPAGHNSARAGSSLLLSRNYIFLNHQFLNKRVRIKQHAIHYTEPNVSGFTRTNGYRLACLANTKKPKEKGVPASLE